MASLDAPNLDPPREPPDLDPPRESRSFLSLRHLRRATLRSLALGLPLLLWSSPFLIESFQRGEAASAGAIATGALLLGFTQLPPALLEQTAVARGARGARGAALIGALAWLLAGVGFLAALLQAEYVGVALRQGPAAGWAALLRLLGRGDEVWPRLLGGLLLAAPLGPVAFLRVREADRKDPGTSPKAIRAYALTAGVAGVLVALLCFALSRLDDADWIMAAPCALLLTIPLLFVACGVVSTAWVLLDWVDATWPPTPRDEA